jgi:hypothetical protein
MIVNYQDAASFSVVGDLSEYGFNGEFLSRASTSTPVVIPYEWELPDGQTAAMSLTQSNRLDSKLNGKSLVSSNL